MPGRLGHQNELGSSHHSHEHHHHHDIEQSPDHEPIISHNWKRATVLGNLAIGAAEIVSGNTSTLSVTADGVHNAGDALSYYIQAENILDGEKHSEEKVQRRRKIGHTIIAASSGLIAGKAGYDALTGHESSHGNFGIIAASASMAMNGLLYMRMRAGIRRKARARGSKEKTAVEKDLTKHMIGLDIPSAGLAMFGSIAQKFDAGIEQYTAIASGLLGAYLFRPTKANLSHDNCPLHDHHNHGATHEHSHGDCNHSHDEHNHNHSHEHKQDSARVAESEDNELATQITSTREEKYQAFVARKRAKRYGVKSKEIREKFYPRAEEKYYAELEHYFQAKIESYKLKADGEDSNEKINNLLLEEVLQIANDDQVQQRTRLINSGNLLEKLKHKYENLSARNKVMVGLGSVAVGSALVAGSGIVAAGVGAGGLAAGLAAGGTAGAWRFMRSRALNSAKLYKKEGSKSLIQISAEEKKSENHSALVKKAIDAMRIESERQIDDSDRIRRRATYSALGAVAVGGAVGVLLDQTNIFKAGEQEASQSALQPATEDIESPEVVDPEPAEKDVNTTDNDEINSVDGSSDSKTKLIEPYSAEAVTISAGEGWYQTFHEMGITEPTQQYELLQTTGAELSQIEDSEGTPFAYYQNFSNGAGEWRMSMTDNGLLPKEALDLINTRARSL